VAIVDVIRATNPREVEWATYKLKYASCKHRPIMMFLELQTKKGFNSVHKSWYAYTNRLVFSKLQTPERLNVPHTSSIAYPHRP